MKNIAFAIAATSTIFGAAQAQLTIEPASPKPFFEVRVKVPGPSFPPDTLGRTDNYDAARTTVTMVGNKITVSPLMVGGLNTSPTPSLDQTLGALPPGTYVVEVVRRAIDAGASGPLGTPLTFTVPARPESAPLANHSDIWWVPDESGWGLNLVHHGSQQIFGSLFVYGTDGKPTWYTIPGGTFTDAATFQATLYRSSGPYFGGPFNPALVSNTPAGTAVIFFVKGAPDIASINATIEGQSFVKLIRRLAF